MCGIVGILAKRPVAGLLVDGLRRLEYRGYDSAGIAILTAQGIERRRAAGKLDNLARLLQSEPLDGNIGIGHTRWATHGKPTENNAHPHATDAVALVHNGIIENYRSLRSELEGLGHVFTSETDTEAVAQLLTQYLKQGMTPQTATAKTLQRLEGAFALGILFKGHDDLLIGARRGSPLAVGYGDGEMYLGSDALALAPLTHRLTYLEEGDWVELRHDGATIHDASDRIVKRPIQHANLSGAMIGKGQYRHFMLKEIIEQPAVIGDTLQALLGQDLRPTLPAPAPDWTKLSRVTIIGCGTAYYAGMVGKYWFEQLAGLPVELDIASEFRYRGAILPADGMTLAISQSGETADTLAGLNYAKQQGQLTAAIVNVPQSSMARAVDWVIPTLAGPEIGVASTKAFTTQLTVLLTLAVAAGQARGTLSSDRATKILQALRTAPALVNQLVQQHERLQPLAQELAEAQDVIFLGRGLLYPIALEGALKLKEVSYIHAEGFAAGELKHGPIALIDETLPVVVMAPQDLLFDKTASNLQEVAARGARVIALTEGRSLDRLGATPFYSFIMPEAEDPAILPMLYVVPLQLLAYYTAVAKGTDVDQPRNLAKSVTVE
jgi:glutamine---fructose-6-phosphate transaminase (isomerizing)